ncbi:MAG: hypothetical protein FH756_10810 [Firmicutes bacterium]|nr:hypothetical protein [Bacillota bacterium]
MIYQQYLPYAIAALGFALAFAGLGVLITNGAEAIYYKLTGKINLKKLYKKKQEATDPVKTLKSWHEDFEKNKELINMSVVVLAMGFLFALIVSGKTLKIYGFVSGTGAGALLYSMFSKNKKKGVRLKKLREAMLIYDAVNVFGETGENLPNTLERILPALDVLRPAIEKFIKRYPYESKEAVLDMEKDMDFPEASLLTSVLLQVIASGGNNMITTSEGVRMETIRKTMYKTEIAVRPLYRQLVLFLPLIVGMSMVLYALGSHVLDSLSAFNSSNIMK